MIAEKGVGIGIIGDFGRFPAAGANFAKHGPASPAAETATGEKKIEKPG